MPEPKEENQDRKQKVGIISRYFPRLRNLFVMKARDAIGTLFHEIKPPGQPITTLKIWDDLQKKISFSDIGTLNKEVIMCERRWDGGVPEWEEKSAGTIMKRTRKIYSTLGHFYDKSIISKEMALAQNNPETVKESITINILGLGKRTFVFSLPKEHELVFSHGLRYKVGYIGQRNQAYYNTLKREITDFCDKIEKELQSKAIGDTKKVITQKINAIKEMMLDLFSPLQNFLMEYENTRRSELSKLSEAANKELGRLQQLVKESKLLQNDIIYVHTYKVIQDHTTETVKFPRRGVIVDETILNCYRIEDVTDDSGKVVEDGFLVDVYFNHEVNPTRDELKYIESMLNKNNKNELINKIKSTNGRLKNKQDDLSKANIALEKKSTEIAMKFLMAKIIDKESYLNIKKELLDAEQSRFLRVIIDSLNSLLDLPEDKLNEEAIENFANMLNEKIKGFKKEGLEETIKGIINKIYMNLTELHKTLLQECGEEKNKLEQIFRDFENVKSEIEQHKKLLGDYVRFELRKAQLKKILVIVNFDGHLKDFKLRGEEIDWGLDKNGYPLEVAEKGYVFERPNEDGTYTHETIEEGTILLDVFNNDRPFRKVPSAWTDYCDTLDMVTWVYCHYDSYRDDLRDGRHHPNSLSITDYLFQMKETEIPYLEFEKNKLDQDILDVTKKVVRVTTRTNSIMRFNGPPFPKNIDKKEVKINIIPTHLNPAFDLRRGSPEANSRKDKHLGKKLYYDIQEGCEKSKNPTMTTRGAALYILANVIERVKFFNEVKELLAAIGDKTEGFDIGPNLQLEPTIDKEGKAGVTAKRWGAFFTKDPFSPIRGQIK